MENSYTKKEHNCRLVQARPETIRFLLGYSRSLHIVECGDLKFESTLN